MSLNLESRFSEFLGLEQIRDKVTVKPSPVCALTTLDLLPAAEKLNEALKSIFLPNDFSLKFIKEVVDRASVRSQLLFSSEVNYLANFYNPPDIEVYPVCLTGLAGIGKSQTIAALQKVLPLPQSFECGHFDGSIELVSHWYASARGKASGKQLLADFLFDDGHTHGRNSSRLLLECRRRANRNGVSLLLLEETQHINTGSGASKVTDILLTMSAIGPPMVYVSNYSLVHKLLKRNSEDKQRLLSEPRVMLPDDPEGTDWQNYIKECVRVSAGHIRVNISELASEIYRCTFGIKRLVVRLLKEAYIQCRNQGREFINMDDIIRAYKSVAYSMNLKDVEELHRQALQGRMTRSRLDLRCPFDLPTDLKSNIVKMVKADRDSRFNNAVFDSSLTQVEREAMRLVKPTLLEPQKKVKKAPSAPLPKATGQDLAKSFNKILESLNPTVKPRKP
ncbi:transposase [Pseudomonas sp. Leaf127]|uniref:transposase n=1 Tax=Pseudomonas sp. Leaf127 TaxID=1736267 RepID=UPI0009E7B30C|nr:transposase [Pseudomonas sp. Leaf127]